MAAREMIGLALRAGGAGRPLGVVARPRVRQRRSAPRPAGASRRGAAFGVPLRCRGRVVAALVLIDRSHRQGRTAAGTGRRRRARRRARGPGAGPRQRAGHSSRRGAVGHRRPDAALQLPLPESGAAPRGEARLAQRPAAVAAVHRPRRLQARQRLVRPPGGESGPGRGRGRDSRLGARDRRRRPLRRRRVRDRPARHRHRGRARSCRAGPRPGPRNSSSCRPMGSTSGSPCRWAWRHCRTPPARRRNWSAPPISPCIGSRSRARTACRSRIPDALRRPAGPHFVCSGVPLRDIVRYPWWSLPGWWTPRSPSACCHTVS